MSSTLVLALRAQLGSLDDDGKRVLRERVKPISAGGEAGDLQHGSGFAVHERNLGCFHEPISRVLTMRSSFGKTILPIFQ
jgi:hypothetical protein